MKNQIDEFDEISGETKQKIECLIQQSISLKVNL